MKADRPQRGTREKYPRLLHMTTRLRDTDVYGHMNNVVYSEYFDTAVNQVLIEARVLDFTASRVIGLVAQTQVHFFAPVTYPEPVSVGVRVDEVGRSSISYGFAMFRREEEGAAAQGGFTHVYVDRDTRRPVPLPPDLRAFVETLLLPASRAA